MSTIMIRLSSALPVHCHLNSRTYIELIQGTSHLAEVRQGQLVAGLRSFPLYDCLLGLHERRRRRLKLRSAVALPASRRPE